MTRWKERALAAARRLREDAMQDAWSERAYFARLSKRKRVGVAATWTAFAAALFVVPFGAMEKASLFLLNLLLSLWWVAEGSLAANWGAWWDAPTNMNSLGVFALGAKGVVLGVLAWVMLGLAAVEVVGKWRLALRAYSPQDVEQAHAAATRRVGGVDVRSDGTAGKTTDEAVRRR